MPLALLFPGQASQKVGMGKEFHDNFPEVRRLFELANDILGYNLRDLCFEGTPDQLSMTQITQPGVFTASYLSYKVFEAFDIRPTVMAGHSLGEYTALTAGGGVSFEEALQLVNFRGQYMQEAVPLDHGAMLAVLGMTLEQVEDDLKEIHSPSSVVQIANINSPDQIVISGHRDAVKTAGDRLRKSGAKRCIELPVSAPFHCDLMKPAAERMRPHLQEANFFSLQTPVIANVTADYYPASASEYPLMLEKQITSPVRWWELVKVILKALGPGATFVEVGPNHVLRNLFKSIEPGANVLSLETLDDLKEVLSVLSEF